MFLGIDVALMIKFFLRDFILIYFQLNIVRKPGVYVGQWYFIGIVNFFQGPVHETNYPVECLFNVEVKTYCWNMCCSIIFLKTQFNNTLL